MGKGGGGIPPTKKVELARWITWGLHSSEDLSTINVSSDESYPTLVNEGKRDRGNTPGKPNGGGGNGGPPKGPPWGASIGLAPACPSAAYEEVMESITD